MDVLLFSGGIESTCLAFSLKPDICLTINYGQLAAHGEIAAAQNIASYFGLKHEILEINLSSIGSGQLAGAPTIPQASIPEFWPYRNQMLITFAAMKYAGSEKLRLLIGSALGDATHQDGTLPFIESMNSLLNMQEGQARVEAPAIEIESIDLLLTSNIDVDVLDMTFSCFDAQYPCGRCRGCIKNEHLRASYFEHRPSCQRTG